MSVLPVTTETFASLSQQLSISSQENQNDQIKKWQRQLRRFSTWEITRYLIPVAAGHLRRVLRQVPELPQGTTDSEGGAKWFTLEEVFLIREHLAKEGSQAKSYLPYRPANLPAKIISVVNTKSGVGKTSTAAHLAMSAAMDGYKVLVIDLDHQGAITNIFDAQVRDKWNTAFPLFAQHYAEYLLEENRKRVGRGEVPEALDDTLDHSLRISTTDLAHSTSWPNIDLIGAKMDLSLTELEMSTWRQKGARWKYWAGLRARLEADQALNHYDLVVVDTPPALGELTLNGLSAADILLVPFGALSSEFEATTRFLEMLHSTFASIEKSENEAARALGQEQIKFEWDAIRALITRYDGSQQAEMAMHIQTKLGATLSPYRQHYSPRLVQAGGRIPCVYETDYRDFNRETYAQDRMSFDENYAYVKRLIVDSWSRTAQQHTEF